MEAIKDLNTYLKGMHKSIEDKLWFIPYLNVLSKLKETIVVDYGCADGALIEVLSKIYPDIHFYGYDNSDEMIDIARTNCVRDNVTFANNLIPFKGKQVILIMSSVFHEIVSYEKTLQFRCELNYLNPDYIFFRDMMTNESVDRNYNVPDLEKIRTHSLFPSYEEYNYGISSQHDILNFLLKYRYKQNWDRELNEIYIPYNIEKFPIYLFPNYSIIYKKHYTLPFLKEKVMEDFGINLVDNTHINMIFKKQ